MPEDNRARISCDLNLDKEGVQQGFIRVFHSTHDSAYGFIPIPIVVFRNGAGPTALLMAGNHGDEYEGQLALCNLAKSLPFNNLRGRIILLPAANLPAALAGRRVSPIDGGNLNRLFPGDAQGSPTARIAWYIEHELIPQSDLVCDLHSGGSSLRYLPTVLTNWNPDPDRMARLVAALKAFGAPHAYISANNPGGDATAISAAERQAVLALGTELGGSGTVTPIDLAIAERGVRNLLVHLEILPSSERIEPSRPTRLLEIRGADYFTYAPESGVFEPLAVVGDVVEAGSPAARIHFPETPWTLPTLVHFQASGLVICQRVPGRTVRGDCLFHLASDVPQSEGTFW